jgi:signal transduction histidine kinase
LRRSGHDPLVAGHAYAVMERRLHQLIRLTDDLLDVSRITRDEIELRRQRIDLRLVLQSAVETTRPLIDIAGHLLTADMPRDPIWIEADLTRLAQAFANLLNNAVRYTPRGGRISVRAVADARGVTVRVSDSGVGIAPAALPGVFDVFPRAGRPQDRDREGLGIGLMLARHLIELHQGSIEATSEGPGLGSTFVVRLPTVSGGIAAAIPDSDRLRGGPSRT